MTTSGHYNLDYAWHRHLRARCMLRERLEDVFDMERRGPMEMLEDRFRQHVIAETRRLQGRYNPTDFRAMVQRYGAVGATKRLLADPRHTSYGFERLWELKALDASVEYAACLPWFRDLLTVEEVEEAESRLILHDFPLQERLEQASRIPPQWAVDIPSTGEGED